MEQQSGRSRPRPRARSHAPAPGPAHLSTGQLTQEMLNSGLKLGGAFSQHFTWLPSIITPKTTCVCSSDRARPLDPPSSHGLRQENSARPPDSATQEEKYQPEEKKETEKKIHIINILSLCVNLNILTFILLF